MNIPILDQLLSLEGFNVNTSLGSLVSQIVGLLLIIAALAAFIYLVWGGIRWIFAGGDKGKLEEARDQITGAIIGLAIVASSWAIFLLLDYFFGLNLVGAGSGSGGGGLCSTSSAAQCQNADPGDSCHNGNQTCFALNNQELGSDGKVRCTCR
jgi:hypothetical protein